MGPRAVCRCAAAGGFRGREPFYVMRWPAAFWAASRLCEFGPRAVCRCAEAGGFYLDLFQLAGI